MANNRLTFKEAVEKTSDIATGYQAGLRALGEYSKKVSVKDTKSLNGSVDIDACTIEKYPNANRWDYALSYKEKVYFVEVHTANTDQVKVVLRKLRWLKEWLNEQAPKINGLKAEQPFVWIPSGKNRIEKNSRYAREISQAKLKLVNSLEI